MAGLVDISIDGRINGWGFGWLDRWMHRRRLGAELGVDEIFFRGPNFLMAFFRKRFSF